MSINMIKRFLARQPDFAIGPTDAPYLLRWWVIPRNRFFNIRVREWGFYCPNGWRAWHQFVRPDAKGEIGNGCGE